MSKTAQPSSPVPDSHRFVLTGGTIHDPLHGRDGVVDDIWVENGRIVAKPADPKPFTRVDASGRVVMPGGVDLHSHVAGPKVNAGRRIAPQLARRSPAAVPTIHSTGALYAALGYTTVFDAAIATAAAGVAHMELADLPILDKGIYLLAADDADVLSALDRAHDAQGDREVQRLIADAVQAGQGRQAEGCLGKLVAIASRNSSRVVTRDAFPRNSRAPGRPCA
jgi:formylmethanofuran dehydrogenase subunit A